MSARDINLIEVYNRSGGGTVRDYALRKIFINPNHVVYLREDDDTVRLLLNGHLPEALDPRQQFTKISLNKGTYGHDVIVVGPISEIHKKLFDNKANLLRG